MAAWGGQGGEGGTQLPSYKLNEAKLNHPDGDTAQKQTTPFWMYAAAKMVRHLKGCGLKKEGKPHEKKLVAFRTETTSSLPPGRSHRAD